MTNPSVAPRRTSLGRRIPREAVEATAGLMGPGSVSALALAEAERLEERGLQVAFYERGLCLEATALSGAEADGLEVATV